MYRKHHLKIGNLLIYIFLIMLLLLSVVPFYLVVINCTHSSFDIVSKLNYTIGNQLINNYREMMSHLNIWRGFFNSLAIAIPFTLLCGYFGALTSYGFAKYNYKYKKLLFALVIGSMMIPSQLGIIGFYQLNLKLGMINTYWPFILPGIANATTVFFLHGIIKQSIPDSMIEAARIEGCGEFKIFNKFIFPCIMPGVATMCIFSFVSSWNNYMGPLINMTENKMYTMPVMIATIKGLYTVDYGTTYLGIAISIIPIIVIYCFCSKYIVDGIVVGSEK